jgi:serine/threonine-protein kinase RsbW
MNGSRPTSAPDGPQPSGPDDAEASPSTAGHARALVIYARLLPAVPTSVSCIRHELDDALCRVGMLEPKRQDIAVVVSEAATNATLHAYRPERPGPIYARASLLRERLMLTVSDAGHGMRTRRDSPGLGVGLALMRRLSQQLIISVPGTLGGTQVMASFDASECSDAPTCDQLHPRRGSDLAREYVQALHAASRELQSDTQALIAQAEQAIRRVEQLRQAPPAPDA